MFNLKYQINENVHILKHLLRRQVSEASNLIIACTSKQGMFACSLFFERAQIGDKKLLLQKVTRFARKNDLFTYLVVSDILYNKTLV